MKERKVADRLLSCLSNPIRLEILRSLAKEPLLSFTDLMRKLGLNVKADTGKFGYHLRKLVDEGVLRINPSAKKYELTELGRRIVDLILTLEDTTSGISSLVVRTSRLQMEPFDRSKIVESLENEARVPRKLAIEIAREAEERILKLNIKYLTAPLIRELVNAILIERGLEDYRHSLTRLGLPVHDVAETMKTASKLSCPQLLYKRANESILAEFALLKVLPRHVGDAHMSGEIHLCDLSGWAIRVNSLNHDLRALIKASQLNRGKVKLSKVLRSIAMMLRSFETHIGVDQGLPFFNVMLAPYAIGLSFDEIKEELRYFLDELYWEHYFRKLLTPASSLTLELSPPKILTSLETPHKGHLGDYEDEARLIFRALMEVMLEGPSMGELYLTPQVHVSLRTFSQATRESEELLIEAHKIALVHGLPSFINLVVGWQGEAACYSAFFTRLGSDWKGDWEVDVMRAGCLGEVVINMPRVAYESAGNDDLFVSGLWDRVEVAMDAFVVKRDSIVEGLSRGLLPLLSLPLSDGQYLRLDTCSFNVSVVGLPEAVKIHVGEYPQESKTAFAFAIRSLRSLESMLSKLSGETGLRLQLSLAPGEDPSSRFVQADIKKFDKSKLVFQGSREHPYYTSWHPLVRSSATPLSVRAKLESMLHPIARGGHVTMLSIGEVELEQLVKLTERLFKEYNIGSLIYDKTLTYCSSCRNASSGMKIKCPKCGASGSVLTYFGRSSPIYKPSQLWSPEEKDFITRAHHYEI
ncbi:MAG: helix-turn-helix domain-containing protein [Candidatus Nezhaarchaeota archaeon]|nr:helix-turn-helix domain-containing protein [Candidatus Nezhaarchaeota archaeon]